MKVIIKKNSGFVVYRFPDSVTVTINENHLRTSNLIVTDINTDNAFMLTGETLPEDEPGELAYIDGSYIYLSPLQLAKREKIYEFNQLVRKLYESIRWFLDELEINQDPIPAAARSRMQLIKQQRQNIISEINQLTTTNEVFDYELPEEQINRLKERINRITD